jgi:peptidoglycan/LPS O-acetylase OafA/YrhL
LFVVCRFLRPSIWQCLAFAAIGVLLARFSVLAGAAVPFFLGGAAYFLYRALAPRWSPAKNIALVVVAATLWVALPLITRPSLLSSLAQTLGGGRNADLAVTVLGALAERQFEFILFPLTVLSLSLSETAWKRLPWSSLHDLGNMSFGIYLLHFPLQLVFVLVALGLKLPADTFTHVATLGLFVLILLIVAAFSYHFFERPAMNALRARWRRSPAMFGVSAMPLQNPDS